jgi:cytoskeletal protein CcmA (bactofilin family)
MYRRSLSMFERSKRDTSEANNDFPAFEARETQRSETPPSRSRDAAVIGPSIQIKGDLSGEEDLIIQGKVNGTIQLREKSLTVGSQGQVDANVLAHSIIVEGKVTGDLYGSERVSIRKTGNVQGNIVSPKVGLDEGCRFKGSIDMDQEMIKKAFAKPSISPTANRQDQAAQKTKSAESNKLEKDDKPSSGATGAKASASGAA